MKIIKEGEIERTVPWYFKTVMACQVCKCEFMVTTEDTRIGTIPAGYKVGPNTYYIGVASQYNDSWEFVQVDCPTCGRPMTVSERQEGR